MNSELRRIVVTGATGFIAKHVMALLLEEGFQVVGTVRNPAKAEEVRATLSDICRVAVGQENLLIRPADLLADGGWHDVMAGADAVMHLAAAVPMREPRDPQSVIRPALEGTERVLLHAARAGINRVVMTSSIAAIGYGHSPREKTIRLGVRDWTDIKGLKGSWAYAEAKTRAELRALEMAEKAGIGLTTVCPSMVFGPALDADTSASLEVVLRLLKGQVPIVPPGGMSVVDVRDVAQIHVNALHDGATLGQRLIASAEYVTFMQVADVLRAAYPDMRFPSLTAPAWLMQLFGRFDRTIRQVAADLKVVRQYDGSSGEAVLGQNYRNMQEATLSAAESLIELGMVN